MQVKIKVIEKNKTWELVKNLIENPIDVDVKWVYKLKLRPDCEISKHKARLVARGFLQKPGFNFDEVYALVARL